MTGQAVGAEEPPAGNSEVVCLSVATVLRYDHVLRYSHSSDVCPPFFFF